MPTTERTVTSNVEAARRARLPVLEHNAFGLTQACRAQGLGLPRALHA